jgi:ketosteroid isomerase-like protein
MLDAGDYAIGFFEIHAEARESGQVVDTRLAEFCRVREGRIYELRAFYYDGPAVVAALSGNKIGAAA